jgi:hypothetical protein
MFCSAMRLNRTIRLEFALLFTLMLPLQGVAAMPSCDESTAAASAPQTHCASASTGIHHQGCGNCCCGAAVALTPAAWVAPRLSAPEISFASLWPPPHLTQGRLDRPPRFIPA